MKLKCPEVVFMCIWLAVKSRGGLKTSLKFVSGALGFVFCIKIESKKFEDLGFNMLEDGI